MHTYSVYIMSNYARTVFYIGITNDLMGRVFQHKSADGGKFTSTYKCHYLMYYEEFNDIKRQCSRLHQLRFNCSCIRFTRYESFSEVRFSRILSTLMGKQKGVSRVG